MINYQEAINPYEDKAERAIKVSWIFADDEHDEIAIPLVAHNLKAWDDEHLSVVARLVHNEMHHRESLKRNARRAEVEQRAHRIGDMV